MGSLKFIGGSGDFVLDGAELAGGLYFPCMNEAGMISSFTPDLCGDAKTGQDTFLLEPASAETLIENRGGRNFWCGIKGGGAWSAAGGSVFQRSLKFTREREQVTVYGGLLWQRAVRKGAALSSDILSFVPAGDDKVEIMRVTVTNESGGDITFTPVAAVPVYGRSAENIRDHRHVTSLLQRAETDKFGITVTNTLVFNERGHKKGTNSYRVAGADGNGNPPSGFIPLLKDFTGEEGALDCPEAVITGSANWVKAGCKAEGFEMVGALRFDEATLKPKEKKTYIIISGINSDTDKYLSAGAVESAFEKTKEYWAEKTRDSVITGDKDFDAWMKWVTAQPVMRRICGCSFLPHHDYGKGGRGWRDLWQDCLALLLTEPESIRGTLLSNFGGVRADGTNATIIGTKPGEFKADRNSITRVWMDHGMWPVLTTDLYINQTGDYSVLLDEREYFADGMVNRGRSFSEEAAACCRAGSVLEHILIQNVTAFFDAGSHGFMLLRNADWNDGLDMAAENGESVAFTAAYAGNYLKMAKWLRKLNEEGCHTVQLAEELVGLLNFPEDKYGNVTEMRRALDGYCRAAVLPGGRKTAADCADTAVRLEKMYSHIADAIKNTQYVSDGASHHWFNSYYDNSGRMVEGTVSGQVRMMLTGQVFTILSGIADDGQVRSITRAADEYLFSGERGGYFLNTDFGEVKTDLGRMFGFAYGHKENGAVFSHMAVMYAYALYSRGFAAEGAKVLSALYKQSTDFEKGRIYPGVPEYFDINGRGMYPYLTGAASWLVLLMQTLVFGVRGEDGDLAINPMLMEEQFDENGKAVLECGFCSKRLTIEFYNPAKLGFGQYKSITCEFNGKTYSGRNGKIIISRADIKNPGGQNHTIKVFLSK